MIVTYALQELLFLCPSIGSVLAIGHIGIGIRKEKVELEQL